MTGPTAARNALVDALHESIDGDYLLGGGGWGADGWVDDIPHDQARISDIVRWAVNAVLTSGWLAAHDAAVAAQARREAAQDIAAAIEDAASVASYVSPEEVTQALLHAARIAREAAAAAPPRPNTQQGDGDG